MNKNLCTPSTALPTTFSLAENLLPEVKALQTHQLQSTVRWAIEELYTCTNLSYDSNLECRTIALNEAESKVKITFRWIVDCLLTDPAVNGWEPVYQDDYEIFDYTHPDFEEQVYQYLEETIKTKL